MVASRIAFPAEELPRHVLELLGLFDRARSCHAAIAVLLKARFAHEAIELTRALFTDSLMLAEAAKRDERSRISLVVGWSLAALADLEGMVREGLGGSELEGDLENIAQRRSQLRAYARRHGASIRHWQPNEKALASAHGREREYLDFRLAHHFVHGSALAIGERYSRIDEETVGVGGPHTDVETWADPTALFASYSMLYAVRAMCTLLSRTEPPDVAALLAQADDLRHDEEAPQG